MTLVIAIKCGDGIVVAADSTATLGDSFGADRTVEQSVQKLEIQLNKVIIGTSGHVGLSQRLCAQLATQMENTILKKTSVLDAKNAITASMWKILESEFDRAKALASVVGMQAASMGAICFTIIALPVMVGGNHPTPVLLQLDPKGSPEEATEGIPFVAIGSGQKYADPFLAFIKRVLWKDGVPETVQQGKFAALWTLRHVIQVNAGAGVGGDPSMAVLAQRGEEWIAGFVSEEEMQELEQDIKDTEDKLLEYRTLDHEVNDAGNIPPMPEQA